MGGEHGGVWVQVLGGNVADVHIPHVRGQHCRTCVPVCLLHTEQGIFMPSQQVFYQF